MRQKRNTFGPWTVFLIVVQFSTQSLQSISFTGEIKKSRNDNLLEKNSSANISNWVPLQRTLKWQTEELRLPVSALSSHLLKFGDFELGLSGTKNSYESMSSGTRRSKSVVEEIEDLAVKFSGQIKGFQDALERMAIAVKSSADHDRTASVHELPLCCQLPVESFHFDDYFETMISKASACWTIPGKMKSNAFIPGFKFGQALANNSASLPQLKWQYFISPEGIHVEYPANTQSCKNNTVGRQVTYNPKGHSERKLWLIQKAKDDTRIHRVVFLIQLRSNSTSTMVKAVRSIVTLLLRFLDNTDEVGIVSSEPDHLKSNFLCDQLVPVTPWTRYQILNYLNYIERIFKWPAQSELGVISVADETNEAALMQKAINMACGNFTNLSRFPPSAATIIHLSSGVNSADLMNKVFQVNCPIFVETYLLKAPDSNEEEVYKMVLQNVASKNIWRVLVFYMSRMEPESFAIKVALKLNSKKEWWSLSDILSQFFPHENSNSSQVYYFSFPHWSATFLETVIVAKKYIFHLGQPLGLVAIEIPMEEFTQHITYFISDNLCDSSSYAFLVDKFGRVIAHPGMGKPDRTKEMPQIQIDHIEVHAGFISLKRKILTQDQGCQSLRLRKEKSWITYIWRSVEPNYVVVLAFLGDNTGCASERSDFSMRKDSLSPKSDVQHHLLLKKNVCCYSQLISVNKAALYLAPNAFLRPADMLNTREQLRIKSKSPLALMAYIGDNSGLLRNQNRGMRTEIKDHISALAKSVPTWKRHFLNSEWSKYILRRFASGAGGTFLLTYPGFAVTSGYVPRSSGWFRKATAGQGSLIFLPPTLDVQSKVPYSTMSQSVSVEINVPFSSEKRVVSVAVMGADISISFFEKTLEVLMPECRNRVTHYNIEDRNISVPVRCFILDDEGFVIYHPYLTKHLKLSPRTHITQLEPLSVIDVLQHGQDTQTSIPLQKRMCHKLSESSSSQRSLRRIYSLSMGPEGIQNLKHGELCSRYVIQPVPGTNLFLSVVQDGCSFSTAFCPCSTVDKLCLNCLRMEPTDCECPCECPREPNFCTSKSFAELPDDTDLCEFPYEPLPMVKTAKRKCDSNGDIEVESHDVFNITCDGLRHRCSSILRIEDCVAAWDCDWCRQKGNPATLDIEPHCMTFTQCIGYESDSETGTVYNRINGTDPNLMFGPNGGGENENQITLVPIIGVLSMFLVFIALVFYCYRHRGLTAGSSRPDLHLLPLQESPMGSVIPQPGSSRSDSDTDPDCMSHQLEIEGRHNRTVQDYAFPPRSPLGSVFGTDSDHGYSTMTPNEDSECGGASHAPVYIDNSSHRLIDTGTSLQTQCQNVRKAVSSRSHSLFC